MSAHARFILKPLALTAFAMAAGSSATAADNTRYVSITGSNANACTLAAPCRTLQFGINQTPAGGELRILDSGFYGNNANIKRSLTISGNGNTVYLGTSIVINDADAVVALRGLTLDGQGTIDDGTDIIAAQAVHIERCVIHGFTDDGIDATADGAELFVIDSIVRANADDGLITTGQSSRLTIDNSHFDNNGSGVNVLAGGQAAISRSTASGNSNSGVFVFGGATLTVESSVVLGNVTGLHAATDGLARISNSTFTDNSTGIAIAGGVNGGTVETRGNNTVRGNTTDVNGTLTAIVGD